MISKVDIRLCDNQRRAKVETSDLGGSVGSNLDFLVVTLTTADGESASSFGWAARGARTAASVAAEILKPFFLGRDATERERHWQEFRQEDRWWAHVPIYAYSAFDICLWDLAARAARQPLFRYLGAFRDRVPVYGSSLVLDNVDAYVAQALEVQARGWHAYKIHPPGDATRDRAIYAAVREAVGPEFRLMADPVAAYTTDEAVKVGRLLEKLDYLWFEEPVADVNFHGLRRLTRTLDIPICGTEVLAGSVYSTAECIAGGVVDIVRADVSWKGGITPVMKTAHLAEAFGVACELHTAVYQPLELINLHCACAISNCRYFELLYPMEPFAWGLAEPLSIDDEGYARPPETPGSGIDLDWEMIEHCTVETF